MGQQPQTDGAVCPKCFHERTKNDDLYCSPVECPKCGVIYTRAQSDTPDTPPTATGTKDLATSLQTLLSSQNSQHKKLATQQIQWPLVMLKFAACALASILLTGAYKTMQATVTRIFTPTQAIQTPEKPIPENPNPIHPVAFPLTHAVSLDNSGQAMTFVFEEDRGQNVILLFVDTKAKTLALRACVRANEKLTTTLPRADLGYIIVTGQAWQGYEDLFGPQTETKKALIPLSSQAKTGNVTAIQATSNMFLQKGGASSLLEAKTWVKTAFKNADEFMKM